MIHRTAVNKRHLTDDYGAWILARVGEKQISSPPDDACGDVGHKPVDDRALRNNNNKN